MTQVLIDRATLEQLVAALNEVDQHVDLKRYDTAPNEVLFDVVMEAMVKGRAALANAEPAGWQPIETAPKDGSFYLAFGEGKTWTQNQPNGCYPGEWYFSESRGEWRGYSLTDESTHWMPLPTQPKDAP